MGVSEFTKCKLAIRGIELGLLLFVISVILFAVSAPELKALVEDGTKPEGAVADKLMAGASLLFISVIVMLVSTLSATYSGCYKTAITGTLLSLLILV